MRVDGNDVSEPGHNVVQLLPLILRILEAQRILMACHPRIDDVVDREMVRRAHQYFVFFVAHRIGLASG